MNISPDDLNAEYQRAHKEWPAIHEAADKWNLPRFLIFAVGSRETNLNNETGDGGHGRGIFQLDDRSHTIPDPFPVEEQAETAAHMLHGLIEQWPGDIRAAVASYNCGAGNVLDAQRAGLDVDYYTAGRDYGSDVLERMHWLQVKYPVHHKTTPAPKATPAPKMTTPPTVPPKTRSANRKAPGK